MNLLDALFSGTKALVREFSSVARVVVREILSEFDKSAIGRSATRIIEGLADHYFSKAQSLADEEQELAEKAMRDGRRTTADAERLREIEAERQQVGADLERMNAERAAQDLREHEESALIARLDDDEVSSNIGILAAKVCPSCGGMMRIRQNPLNGGERTFYWQCTRSTFSSCPTIKLDPRKSTAGIVRLVDPDLDTPKTERRGIWNRPDIIADTHGRVRQHLGDDDKQIICPKHILPMKLFQKRHAGGKLLDSYEYICLGVNSDGTACNHKVEIHTMPQVASVLRRAEGEGIIRN